MAEKIIPANDDERFMLAAIEEARCAAERDEVPVGAVVVCAGRIIARAHNLTETLTDVTAHAEELSVDGLNPSTSELTFGLIVHLLKVGGLCRKKEKEGRKEESGKRCLDAGACRRKNMFHRLQGTFKNEEAFITFSTHAATKFCLERKQR